MMPDDIQRKLKNLGIMPAKIRGQHFLLDEIVVLEMVEAARVSKKDTVLEIGPGLGILTDILIEKAGKVVVVEIDHVLAQGLQKLASNKLKIIEDDILKVSLPSLIKEKKYKVVANIPYNITSLILQKLLEGDFVPEQIVLLVQEEVAKKIVNSDKKTSRLSLFVEYYGTPCIIRRVKKCAFWPEPKVESAVLQIIMHSKKVVNDREAFVPREYFFKLISAGFSSPRKKMINNLGHTLGMDRDVLFSVFDKIGISRDVRAEDVVFGKWLDLAQVLYKNK